MYVYVYMYVCMYNICMYNICAVYTCKSLFSLLQFAESVGLTNREKAFKYLATSSLFEGGQIPPLVVICCIKELLWGSSILHA